uniref:Transposase n=1 Tax=Heterorhabditis bacteriophora TaxID=37862 RepID=A0A1I7WSS6_HETBA
MIQDGGRISLYSNEEAWMSVETEMLLDTLTTFGYL